MISYSSCRVRESFAPPETTLRGRRPVSKAKTTLTKRPMGAPAGRSDTAYRLTASTRFSFRAPRLKERASVLREGTALGPRGPHVPWTGNAYAFQLAASTPVLRPRSGRALSARRGNPVKRRKRILTISLFRRGARSSFDPPKTALGPGRPHVPWTGNVSHFHWQPRPNPSSARLLIAAPLNMKTYNPRSAWAWQAVIATRFTMSLTEQPRERSLIGAAIPCRIGPMASASASR